MRNLIPLIVIISSMLESCSSNKKDDFMRFKFGKAYQSTVAKFESKGILKKNQDEEYTYYYNLESGKYKAIVKFNDDGYYRRSLDRIKIYFGGDTIFFKSINDFPSKTNGQRERADVMAIFNYYRSVYGKEDTIIGTMNRFVITRSNIPGNKNERFENRTFIWHTLGYEIRFVFGNLETIEKKGKDYFNTPLFVEYRDNNYLNKLEFIKDSLRKRFEPNNLIFIKLEELKWENLSSKNNLDFDTKIKLSFSFERKDTEEPRGVVALKFDFIVLNSFDEEITRFNDIENTFYKSLECAYYKDPDDRPLAPLVRIENSSFEMKYNTKMETDYVRQFEQARKINSTKRLYYKFVIKAVRFADGEVLKSRNQ